MKKKKINNLKIKKNNCIELLDKIENNEIKNNLRNAIFEECIDVNFIIRLYNNNDITDNNIKIIISYLIENDLLKKK